MAPMTTNVVTSVSDLTPAMRDLLRRPAEPDLPAETREPITFNALRQRGLVTLVSRDPLTYRLTDAGKRCRDALERQDAPTVVVQQVAGYGWAMVNENDFGGHSITTWTRDEHTLVLVYTGAYEVSAAVYDGAPLPLDQLVEVITDEGGEVTSEHLMELAARRAAVVASSRFAAELAELFAMLAKEPRTAIPQHIRWAAERLAAALLATPHAR
jgi:hypothetical protein